MIPNVSTSFAMRERPESGLDALACTEFLSHRMYFPTSFRRSNPPHNRQIIVHYYQLKYKVDSFVGGLTF